MRRERRAGWTLVELLATLALVGMAVTLTSQILSSVGREMRAVEREERRFFLEMRLVTRLRSDLAEALAPKMDAGELFLNVRGQAVRWRWSAREIRREAASAHSGAPAVQSFPLPRPAGAVAPALDVNTTTNGWLVHWRLSNDWQGTEFVPVGRGASE